MDKAPSLPFSYFLSPPNERQEERRMRRCQFTLSVTIDHVLDPNKRFFFSFLPAVCLRTIWPNYALPIQNSTVGRRHGQACASEPSKSIQTPRILTSQQLRFQPNYECIWITGMCSTILLAQPVYPIYSHILEYDIVAVRFSTEPKSHHQHSHINGCSSTAEATSGNPEWILADKTVSECNSRRLYPLAL